MPLVGSSAQGIFRLAQPPVSTPTPYVPGGADESGVLVINAEFGGAKMTADELKPLEHDFEARSFRLMDVTEIQAYLQTNGPAGYAFNKALSVTDTLGIQIAGPPGATTSFRNKYRMSHSPTRTSPTSGWRTRRRPRSVRKFTRS